MAEAKQKIENKGSTNGSDLLIAGPRGLGRGLKLAGLVGL